MTNIQTRSRVCRAAAFISVALVSASRTWAADAWPPAPALVVAAETNPGSLPASVTAEALPSGAWQVTFQFAPGLDVRRVNLAGSFNGWSADRTPMNGPDGNGRFSATVELPGGQHAYKFVINGNDWRRDPLNSEGEPDNHGGQNSVIKLGAVANLTASVAKVGDGQIEALAIEHQPERPFYFQRLGGGALLLRVRTLAHDVERVGAAVRTNGDTVTRSEMSTVKEDGPFAWWETTVAVPGSAGDAAGGKIEYTFLFYDGSARASSPKTYHVDLSMSAVFTTPDWAKHAVWYQIFPERFRNGDPGNDPDPVMPWTSEWFMPQPWEGKDGSTFFKSYVYKRRYGGDLQGIMAGLPYLKELGVNALYLNPVFEAVSLHKYDATSYAHIDNHFGVKGDYAPAAEKEDLLDPRTWIWTESDKLFLQLVQECHKHGLKVIIDGVFNHVGVAHPAFQDVLKNGQKSRFADWFNVESWEPFKYRGWAGVQELPEFRKDDKLGLASATLREHIFAITRRWMDPDGDGDPSDGVDGWRLDVPNEVPMPFWVEWRKVVKGANPDAYITGEIWQRADAWLDGQHFDAVMNYEFSKAVVAWVFDQKWKINASEFDRRLRELRLAYPLEATLVMQNLMNSHDTDRSASMAHNPDRHYDDGNRVQDNGPNYDNSKPSPAAYKRARLAAFLQMTYMGAPMVYYGDEVGMWGGDDPTCRKPMLWKDLEPYEKPEENFVMADHLAHYKRVIALRNAHPALRTGALQTLLANDDANVWVTLRKNDDEQLVVAANASEHDAEVTVPLPKGAPSVWRVVYGPDAEAMVKAEGEKLKLKVPATDGVALHAATPK